MPGGEIVGYHYKAGTKNRLREEFEDSLVDRGLKVLKNGMTRSQASDELSALGWSRDYVDTFVILAFKDCV